MTRVLIVEDDTQTAEEITAALSDHGFAVDRAATGREGLLKAAAETFDAIVLDRMLPGGIDGLGVLATLRAAGVDAPVLILSALSGVDERVRGLRAGGDDYLTKPFDFLELTARLDVLLRRQSAPQRQTMLRTGKLEMDLLTPRRSPRRPPDRAASAGIPPARIPDAPRRPGRHPHHVVRGGLELSFRRAHQCHRHAHQQNCAANSTPTAPIPSSAPSAVQAMCSVRLVDLPRTTSFQLALRFLLLFGAASLALFAFLYWQTANYIAVRTDDWLVRAQAIFSESDEAGLRQRLGAYLVAAPSLERPLTLFDAAGRRLAGSMLDLPAAKIATLPHDRLTEFTIRQGNRTTTFRAILHQRASGEVLLVARDMDDAHTFDRILIDAFIWGGLFTAVLGLVGAAIVGAGSVRRIDAITRAIQRIVSGDLSERLPTQGRRDDFDRLAVVINGMLAEIERLMQEVKGVCDNIAHDLRTPLTRLLAGLERTRRRSGPIEDHAFAIDEAIAEMRGVLKTFAALLRISEVESGARRAGFTDADISEVLADAVELYEPAAEASGIRLWLAPQDNPAVIRGDPNLLFEVVANLIDNALKFTQRGGCVTVRGFAGNGTIGFEVEDTGPGIPVAERDAVQRRFYRTEASRHTPGSGLGLALVVAVARLHGMDLTIASANPGCRITIARMETGDPPSSAPAERASVPA